MKVNSSKSGRGWPIFKKQHSFNLHLRPRFDGDDELADVDGDVRGRAAEHSEGESFKPRFKILFPT